MKDVRFADVAILLGGVGLLLGPFLPFVSAATGFGGFSRSGIEWTGGEAFILVGLGAFAGFLGFQRATGVRPGGIARWLPGIVGAVALLLSGYYWSLAEERVRDAASDVGFVSVGMGLWLCIGAAVAIIGGTLTRQRRLAS